MGRSKIWVWEQYSLAQLMVIYKLNYRSNPFNSKVKQKRLVISNKTVSLGQDITNLRNEMDHAFTKNCHKILEAPKKEIILGWKDRLGKFLLSKREVKVIWKLPELESTTLISSCKIEKAIYWLNQMLEISAFKEKQCQRGIFNQPSGVWFRRAVLFKLQVTSALENWLMERIIAFNRYRRDLTNEVINLILQVLDHTLFQAKLILILFNSNITQSIKVRLYIFLHDLSL